MKIYTFALTCFALTVASFTTNVDAAEYQTRYVTSNGQSVDARLTLNIASGSGHYVTSDGSRGWISHLVCRPPQPGEPAGTETVTGRWRFQNGATGTLHLRMSGNTFNGHWSYGSGSPAYPWNGRRIGWGPGI